MKYRTGVDTFQPGTHTAQDNLSPNAQLAGEWMKQSDPNGKSFYYNVTTGAAQWSKTALNSVPDPHVSSHLRQMPQAQGQIAQNAGPEHGLLPTPPPPLPPLQPVHQQLPSSQQVLSPPTMQQSGQHSPDGE